MRPRREGRGNHAARPLSPRGSKSFNEAAARRPRKSFLGSLDECGFKRFNEAAARRPRKSTLALRATPGEDEASMRPRREGRGNPPVVGAFADYHVSLQ